MKLRITALAFGLALATLVGVGMIRADEGKSLTVQGEILDLACYIAHEAKGEEHAKCATACVKGGQPMGLLAKDGTVYVLYAGHEDATAFETAKDHAGKQVQVEGKHARRAGIEGIEVASVKAM